MIALIPGFTAALAYLQPQPSAPPAPQEGFSPFLAAAAPSGQDAAPPKPLPPSRYVVQPGDNLTCIAKKLGYDDPLVLAQVNKLKNPNLLQVGQVLMLPENTSPPPTLVSQD